MSHTTFNCTDAFDLSEWWKQVLHYVDDESDPNEPGDEECVIVDPIGGHRLLFIEVDALQEHVGRVHLDLAPSDGSRDDEVDRVLALGARQVADRRNADGTGWVVLADPSGNCFCIVRSDDETTYDFDIDLKPRIEAAIRLWPVGLGRRHREDVPPKDGDFELHATGRRILLSACQSSAAGSCEPRCRLSQLDRRLCAVGIATSWTRTAARSNSLGSSRTTGPNRPTHGYNGTDAFGRVRAR